MTTPRHIAIIAILSTLSFSGCALLTTKETGPLSETQSLKPSQLAGSEDNVPVRRIVRLDTSIVSALSTDKRIRDLAWAELDEAGPLLFEDRRRLNESGIRVGVSGGSLSWGLASLVRGERVQQDADSARGTKPDNGRHSSSFGSHLAIPEGSSSIVELPNEDGMLVIPAGRIAGLYSGAELEDSNCVLQITATEYGDGWVVLRFLPQIQHGIAQTRYSVSGQKTHPLYEQQFEVKLHADETVVIGYQSHDDWTAGRLLFQEDTLASRNERMVVLKLEQIEEVKGQQQVTVDYRKY